jgi:hypothetical protein
MGVGVVMMVMWASMCRLWSFAAPLTSRRSIPAIYAIAVLPIIFSQSGTSLSAVRVVVGIRLSGWTAA